MLPAKDPECFRDASNALPRIAMLGPTEIIVQGAKNLRLPPTTLAVLLRLAVASGQPVPVDQVFRDVWRPLTSTVGRGERVRVQQRITELRHALGKDVIQTEQDGRGCSYKLAITTDRIDGDYFLWLMERARLVDSLAAADLLQRALDLWRGRPLMEVEHLPFADAAIRRLTTLWESAARDLVEAYLDLGRLREALTVGERLASSRPHDTELHRVLEQVREELRRYRRGVVRRALNGVQAAVVIVPGDIFAEHDAHLVVGFTDTFDTDTSNDQVISASSLQAQAARVLFADDVPLFERQLRAALRDARRVGRESRVTKKHGKLVRYEIGTVAVLRQANRHVFALAYSRMGNDLVARSTLDDIRVSLERLWDAVYRHGQLRPIAVPLMGTGLARVEGATPTDLLKLIAGSFITRSLLGRVSQELRVVIRPTDLANIDLNAVADDIDRLAGS